MRFSIITVTKNNKEGLLRAIECVRNQTYKNIEHIIVDGGSTDGSVEILRQAQDNFKNSLLLTTHYSQLTTHYSLLNISEADSGIYDAINKGIKLATGDVIGLLHSDDLYADENVIAKYAEVFNQPTTNKKLQTIATVYSDLVYVRMKQEVRSEKLEARNVKTTNYSLLTTNYSLLPTNYSIIRYWKTHKSVNSNQLPVNSKNTDHYSLITNHSLRFGWMPPHPTLFIRKEIFEKYGLYNTDLKIASDYDMILRLFYKHKISSYYLPLTSYIMTLGGASNKSIGNIIQKSKEDLRSLRMNGINFPFLTLISKNFRKLPQFLARDL